MVPDEDRNLTYTVIETYSRHELIEAVNGQLVDGWYLVGGVAVVLPDVSNAYRYTFLQAMVFES